jgi:hypothetical protein
MYFLTQYCECIILPRSVSACCRSCNLGVLCRADGFLKKKRRRGSKRRGRKRRGGGRRGGVAAAAAIAE